MRILFIEIVRPKFPAEDLDKVLKSFVAERLIPWNKVKTFCAIIGNNC